MTESNRYQKVLLLNPPGKIYVRPDGTLGERKHCTPPLGLAYLAASLLKFDYDVEVLDVLAEGYDNEIFDDPFLVYGLSLNDTVERVMQAKPDVVGISVLFSNRAFEAFQIAAAIKERLPETMIVFGGQHPTATPNEAMNRPEVDFVISGEADETMVHLMEALNGRSSFGEVKGLHYRDENGAVRDSMEGVPAALNGNGYKYYNRKNAPIPLQLDELPYPAWHLFNMDAYWNKNIRLSATVAERERFGVMMSTRGCPHTCYFCTSPLLSGFKAYRRRTVDDVLREIHWLKDEYGVEEIQFLDDNFFVSAPRVKDLCRRIAEDESLKDILFSVPAGTEVNALDEEMVDLLAAANFYRVVLAIEAGDQEIQDQLIDKKVKLDRVPHMVDYLHSKGISVHSLLMVGFPDESAEQIEKTVDMAMSVNWDDFYISIVTPLPGTPLFDECLERGLLSEDFDSDNLRYSYSNIQLPETSKDALERVRREAWLAMKSRKHRETDAMTQGTYRDIDVAPDEVTSEYEYAGIATDLKNVRAG